MAELLKQAGPGVNIRGHFIFRHNKLGQDYGGKEYTVIIIYTEC